MNKIKIIVSWQNFGVCILILRSVVQKFENKVYATLPRKSFTAFWQSLNSSRDLELSSSWWNIRQSLLLFQCSLYNEHEQNIRCHCWEISTRQHYRLTLWKHDNWYWENTHQHKKLSEQKISIIIVVPKQGPCLILTWTRRMRWEGKIAMNFEFG